MTILDDEAIIKKYGNEIFHFKQSSLQEIKKLESYLKDKVYVACLYEDKEQLDLCYAEITKIIKDEQLLIEGTLNELTKFNTESINVEYEKLINKIKVTEYLNSSKDDVIHNLIDNRKDLINKYKEALEAIHEMIITLEHDKKEIS